MKNKFRHELKYFINLGDYYTIKNRLKHFMVLDQNAGGAGYKIRSLYFDNANNKALMEKISGINNREKFRIRFYNGNSSYIKLEKKSKINGLCRKEAERITEEECRKIIHGDIEFLKLSEKELFVELYTKMKGQLLKPKTIVDYDREAYIYPPGNVRVTFDKKVRTGIVNVNMFDNDAPTIDVIPNNQVILEVKFDEFLPEIIQDIVQTNNRSATSISKYVACRMYG